VQVDQINLSGILEQNIVFKTSGWIKERTQTSNEMGGGKWVVASRSMVRMPVR